jgi:hypothetical protein
MQRNLASGSPLVVAGCICLATSVLLLAFAACPAALSWAPLSVFALGFSGIFSFLGVICGLIAFIANGSKSFRARNLHQGEERMVRLGHEPRQRDTAPPDERMMRIDEK